MRIHLEESENMSNKKAVKSFLWGTLTGVITGAVAALLLAPKSGRELRSDISDTAQRVGEKTADLSRQAGSAVKSLAKKTSEVAAETKQAASQFVTDIRSRKSNGPASENEVAVSEEIVIDDNSAAL
jgi:gas vesicle protein